MNSKRLLHSAYEAHTVNLIAKTIENKKAPQFLKNVYNLFNQISLAMSFFDECGIEKPPKNIKTIWLTVMNQLMYLRKHDIFFAGFSNPNYPGTVNNSFLLDNGEDLFDPLGIDFRKNAKYGEHHKQFL